MLPRILTPSGVRAGLPSLKNIALSTFKLAKKVLHKLVTLLRSIVVGTYNIVKMAVTDRENFKLWLKDMWVHFKEEMHHYKLGFKLFWSDIKTAAGLARRVLGGNPLSRRERKQLVRTTGDIFRLVPFSFFLIVPFMEFFLPIAIKLFPNMLPSQFQTSLKKEEDQKKILQSRIELARFLQDTVSSAYYATRSSFLYVYLFTFDLQLFKYRLKKWDTRLPPNQKMRNRLLLPRIC